MFNPVSKIAVAAVAVLGSVAIASEASAAPGGSYIITNNASVQVDNTADSFSASSYNKKFAYYISARSTSSNNYAYQRTDGNVFVGTTMWQNKDSKYGCSFTTVITYSSYTGRYTFSFSSAKLGGAASTATCSITASRNVYSGSFTAYPVIGGF